MGTNNADDLLDYMFTRLNNRFKPGISQGRHLKEKERVFKVQLKAVSKKLSDDERIVLIIDGLDEASEVPQLLDALPREYIDRVLVIYASRENSDVKNTVYDKLEREKHEQTDLGGLTVADTRALLYAYINKYELEKNYVKVLRDKSRGNPLYIKLICQGLEDNLYKLNDTVNLPDKLNEIYENIIKRLKESDKSGSFFDLLMVLAAGKDFFSRDMIADVMGMTSQDADSSLHACMEILIEDPSTESLLDYQLFHESLREYLVDSYKADLKKWQQKLSDWCLGWKDLTGESELYALKYLIVHLNELYSDKLKENKGEKKTEALLNEMIKAVEDENFRKRTFEVCGNDVSLKNGLMAVQKILAKTDKSGSNMVRFFKYARMLHEEKDKMAKVQLTRIVEEANECNLENITQLSKMGSTTRDNLMLTIRALWEAPRKTKIPLEMRETTKKWLGEISDPVMDKLMDISLKRFER